MDSFETGSEDRGPPCTLLAFVDDATSQLMQLRFVPSESALDYFRATRAYLSPQVEGFAQHTLFRTYPSEEMPGLRVFVPSAEYMLAMKLMALRLDPASNRSDLDDILNLMQVVGLREKTEIVRFAARFYPEARISGKLALSVDYLWNEYTRCQRSPADDAPRYLGRSGPAG